jgi:hypothetical protein
MKTEYLLNVGTDIATAEYESFCRRRYSLSSIVWSKPAKGKTPFVQFPLQLVAGRLTVEAVEVCLNLEPRFVSLLLTRYSLHKIAATQRHMLQSAVGPGWYSSQTKIIDNALVGYVVEALRVEEE